MPPDSAVMHHANSYFHCHGSAQPGSRGQRTPGPPAERGEQCGKDRPGQAEGEEKADVTETAGIACAARPAHLVLEKPTEAVSRQMRFHHHVSQNDFIT